MYFQILTHSILAFSLLFLSGCGGDNSAKNGPSNGKLGDSLNNNQLIEISALSSSMFALSHSFWADFVFQVGSFARVSGESCMKVDVSEERSKPEQSNPTRTNYLIEFDCEASEDRTYGMYGKLKLVVEKPLLLTDPNSGETEVYKFENLTVTSQGIDSRKLFQLSRFKKAMVIKSSLHLNMTLSFKEEDKNKDFRHYDLNSEIIQSYIDDDTEFIIDSTEASSQIQSQFNSIKDYTSSQNKLNFSSYKFNTDPGDLLEFPVKNLKTQVSMNINQSVFYSSCGKPLFEHKFTYLSPPQSQITQTLISNSSSARLKGGAYLFPWQSCQISNMAPSKMYFFLRDKRNYNFTAAGS